MGYVLTFAQQKGGSGKTTLLAHLAAEWAAAGLSVALFDLDPQKSLTRWAETRADPNLQVIESRDYRASGDIRAARRIHERVLVDCPGAASSLLDNVMRESDLVVAPCQPSAVDVWASDSIVGATRRLGTRCCILLNRVPPRATDLDEILRPLRDRQTTLLQTRIGNRVGYSRSLMRGVSAGELSRRSAAAREISALRAELDTLLQA